MRWLAEQQPGKWVASTSPAGQDRNLRVKYNPNKGGRPIYQVEYDGQRTHRMRRGKLVEIPPEWRGHTLHEQTKRKRNPVKRRTRKEHR